MTKFTSKRLLRCLAAGTLMSAALGIGSASAVPMNWHLSGVTFDDGGTASGSFTFDAAGGGYSNINIVTTSGAARSGDTYIAVCGTDVPSCDGINPPSDVSVLFLSSLAADQTGAPAFALNFQSPLTDLGGATALFFSIEASCNSPDCFGPDLPERNAVSGFVTTAVPEPMTGGLLLAGLGAMFATRRRRGATKKA